MITFIRATFLFLILSVSQVWATDATILPQGLTQFFDNNGNPLSSGKVYFYIPNTLTFKTTWQNAGKTITNTNPVTLDAAGRATIYGDGIYRQILRKSDNTLVWDALTASTGTGGGTGGTGDGTAVGTVLPFAGLIAPTNYVFSYGQELSRASFPGFLSAITFSSSVTCSIGSPTVNIADTTQIPIGSTVELSCVAPGTTVSSKTSSSVTFNNNSTLTTIASAVFFPFGNGNGTTTFNTPDLRGRVIAGRDCMGGTAASRLTSTYFAACGTGAIGGSESHSLIIAELAAHTHSGTTGGMSTNTPHTHTGGSAFAQLGTVGGVAASGGAGNIWFGATANNVGSTSTEHTHTFVSNSTGSGTAFSIIQPTMELNYIIKVIPDTGGGGSGGGTGTVVGPASSTDNAIVRWDGITGALIKDTPSWLIVNGMFSFGVSGGDQGIGTINAGGFFVNAIPVVTTTGLQTLTNKTISGANNTLTILANTQLTNQVPIANGGTGQATAQAARGSSGLNIDGATSTGDANYVILPADRLIYHTALSAARTDTLPAANAVNVGQTLYVPDIRGVATASNTLTLQRAGADTLNGGTTLVVWDVAFSTAECWSDGVSRWTCQKFSAGGGGGGVSSVTIAAGTNITLSGTCTITSTGTCTINAANSTPGGSNTNIQYNNAGVFGGLTDAQVAGRVIGGSNLQIQYNNAGVFGALTDTQLAARITPLNNTWTGINKFTGNSYFNGSPMVDVRSGANGCAAAVGDGTTNDRAAIQCQIDYMNTTYGGGIVLFCNASFKVTSTLTWKPGIILQGCGQRSSNITSGGADITVLNTAGAGNDFMHLRDLSIFGNQTAGATQVLVTANGVTNMSNCSLWGGLYALQMAGSDGTIFNCFIMGFGSAGGNAVSNGSNWYIRVKFDDAGQTHLYGFWQQWDGVSAVSENHFELCDFTGNFTSAAVKISGGANVHIMTFLGGVLAPAGGAFAVENDQARRVSLTGVEIGADISVNAIPTAIVASYGFSGINAIGAQCSVNTAITC